MRGQTTLSRRARTLWRLVKPPPVALPAEPPLVSVVISTYNWSSVLHYAIRSVRWQRYPRWELIVVGDACSDNSEQVVGTFDDPRIRWHNLEQNSGSQAIPHNAGVDLARGDYVAYLGHDDLWAPDHLSRLVSTIFRARADLAFALTEVFGPPGSGLRVLGGVLKPGTYIGGRLAPSSVLHRTAIADEIGPWRDYREIELPPDDEFFRRAYDAGNRFASSLALTVFKFSASIRRNSYRLKNSDEQAEMARRIESQLLFRQRELLRLVGSRLRHHPRELQRHLPRPEAGGGPGAWVRATREIRGLE